MWPWHWLLTLTLIKAMQGQWFRRIQTFLTISSRMSGKRSRSADSWYIFLLLVWRHWTSHWRHKWRQNHIIGHNSGSNCHRPFMLSSYESMSKVASSVTFLIFDLDIERLRLWSSQLRHELGQMHIIADNFCFNCHRNLISSSYDSISEGNLFVSLTNDLDMCNQG